jgi:hypothetical protein
MRPDYVFGSIGTLILIIVIGVLIYMHVDHNKLKKRVEVTDESLAKKITDIQSTTSKNFQNIEDNYALKKDVGNADVTIMREVVNLTKQIGQSMTSSNLTSNNMTTSGLRLEGFVDGEGTTSASNNTPACSGTNNDTSFVKPQGYVDLEMSGNSNTDNLWRLFNYQADGVDVFGISSGADNGVEGDIYMAMGHDKIYMPKNVHIDGRFMIGGACNVDFDASPFIFEKISTPGITNASYLKMRVDGNANGGLQIWDQDSRATHIFGRTGNVVHRGNVEMTGAAVNTHGCVEFGKGVRGKQTDAGRMCYQKYSKDSLDIVGAGNTTSGRKVKLWDRLEVNQADMNRINTQNMNVSGTNSVGNLQVGRTLSTMNGIIVQRDNPGPLIEKKYNNNNGDRYGVGQFASGTTRSTRVYHSGASGSASTNLSIANRDGTFRDVVKVNNSGLTTVDGALRVQRGYGTSNWLHVQGNYKDNVYIGSDSNNRGIRSDGQRNFTMIQNNRPGITIAPNADTIIHQNMNALGNNTLRNITGSNLNVRDGTITQLNVPTRLNVPGSTTFGGAMTVNNAANFTRGVTACNVTVTGNTTLRGPTTVTGNATFGGTMTANNTANFNRGVTANTLSVTGNTTFGGTMTANNTANFNRGVTANTVNVTGNTTLRGPTTVAGNTTFGGTMTANNTANFNRGVTANTLNVTGATTVGGLTVNNAATFRQALTANNATVTGNATLRGPTTVTGNATFGGMMTANNTANFTRGVTANTLTVSGTTSFGGAMTVNNAANFRQALTASNLSVTGNTSLAGPMTVNNIAFLQDVNARGITSSNLNIMQDVTISNRLCFADSNNGRTCLGKTDLERLLAARPV